MTIGFDKAEFLHDSMEPDGAEVSDQVQELQERVLRLSCENDELQEELDEHNVKMRLTISQINYLKFILTDKLTFLKKHAMTEFDNIDIKDIKTMLKQLEG